MTGLSSRTILGQAKRGKFDLVMPQVVFLEMVNKMRERIETATGKMAKGASSLRKIGVGDGIAPPDPAPLTKKFTADLEARIADAGTLVPIAGVGHEELVARSIKGTRPFRSSGVGYRDALIWLTVLEQADEHDVVFVSGNSKDFAEEGKLHPVLAEEVAWCKHSVTLLETVEEFIEKFVPPADQALAKAQQLLSDAFFKAGLEGEIFDLLIDEGRWPYHSAIALVPNQPEGLLNEGPLMIGVASGDPLTVRIEDAVEFDPEDEVAVLTISVTAELLLDLLFDKGDAHWLLESEAEISFYDFDYNETYAAGQTLVYVKGELQALFKDDQIEQLELISLEDLPADDPDHPASQN